MKKRILLMSTVLISIVAYSQAILPTTWSFSTTNLRYVVPTRSYPTTTYNIKPDDITSEDQLLRVLSSVKQAEDNVFNNKFKGIMGNNIFNKGSNQKPADVFDLKGNRIKNTDNIMGGKKLK